CVFGDGGQRSVKLYDDGGPVPGAAVELVGEALAAVLGEVEHVEGVGFHEAVELTEDGPAVAHPVGRRLVDGKVDARGPHAVDRDPGVRLGGRVGAVAGGGRTHRDGVTQGGPGRR